MAVPPWDDDNLARQLNNASYSGRDTKVIDLLRRGADPNCYYTLHWACDHNIPHIAVTLILWGADLRRRDGAGQTPLHRACVFNSMACVKVCLEHHSPTDIKDIEGKTPVDLAREGKHNEVADYITNYRPLARSPLSEYPSIKQLSQFQLRKWGKLGLHFDIPKHQMEGIRKGRHPTTETFLAAKVRNMELNWRNVVQGLLGIGEDRRWMETALIVSIHYGILDLLRYLVDTQRVTLTATVRIEGSDVCTLSHTCSRGYTDVTKYLIMEKKIHNILEDRRWMKPALSLSVQNGILDLLQYLVDTVGVTLTATVRIEGSVVCTLSHTCSRGYTDVAKYLIMEKKIHDILEDRRWMENALSFCVEYGMLDLLPHLIINEGDKRTALSVSIHQGFLEVLRYLVDTMGVALTATIHIEGSVECTLYYVSSRVSDVTEYLKEKKPFVNDSLLHASKSGHLAEATFLLTECHADPNVTDSEGNTPLALTNDPDITILLLKHGAKAENVYKTHSKQIGKLSSERPPEIPLTILITGDGGVGKSTFLKSMLSSKGFLAIFSKAKPVTGVDEKTVGIIPYEVVTKDFGRVICHDFAGQHEFYASHCAILQNALQTSPPIILYLADLREEDEQKTVDSIARWMTLVQNQCLKLRGKAHVIVVGSHADILREKQQDPWSKERIFAPIFKKFPKFKFIDFIPLDCRYPDTDQMKQAKKLIQKSSAVLRSPETISLNAHTFYIYLLDSFKDDLAACLKDVQDRIHRDLDQEVKSKRKKNLLSFIPSTLPRLVEICQQLSQKNLILYLHNKVSPERSFIICDCTTLLSNVTGSVFAPENSRQHCELASSTGVVPLSRFSEQFQAYDIEMLIEFMSHLELCFEIKDQIVLKYIRVHEDNPEPDGRFLFFPGLIRIETPEKVWEEDTAMTCHFGWIIECSQDTEFFDPRCLQVLILRLVFVFRLAPARKVQKHIPSLQRYCSVWKNGIFWCNDDGVNSHIELSDNGKSFVLKMRSRVFKPELLLVRSKITAKVLETVKDFCPNITTVESVLNPHEVIKHPLSSAASLTLYSITDIALAIALKKEDVKGEHRSLALSQLLQLEPYASLDQDTIQCICSEKTIKSNRVSDLFVAHFVNQVSNSKHVGKEHISTVVCMYMTILGQSQSPSARVATLSDSPKQELIHAFKTWRDKTEGTYSCLRESFNKYSIFTGRNPLDLAGVAHSDCDPSLIFPEPPPENLQQENGSKAVQTPSSARLEGFCTYHGLTSNDIDQKISNEHILEIYARMVHPIRVANHLDLSQAVIESIKFRAGDSMELMRLYTLQMWKDKGVLNDTATYQVLLEALLLSGNEETALEVCKLLGH